VNPQATTLRSSFARNLLCVLAGALLCAATAHAAERPCDLSVLLADAPTDALGVIYLQRPADVWNHPVVLAMLQGEAPPAATEALQTLTRLFDGPTALVVTGSPLRPDLLAVTLTAQVSLDRDTFFKTLDEKLLAALNRLPDLPGAGAIGFERTGDLAVVRIPGPMPIQMTFALRNGFVRASTNRALVDAWLNPPVDTGGDKPKMFLDTTDYQRIAPDPARSLDLLVYVNTRTLMPLAKMGLPHDIDVYSILGLGQFEAAALTASWSKGQYAADLTVCLAGEPSGILRLLQGSGQPVQVARVFPADTVVMLGGTFPSGAVCAEQLNALLELIDPEIVEEYEQERADFVRDFGFDLQADFLGNFVGEWAVGVRAAENLPDPVLAVRVADPIAFSNHMAALASAFDLRFDTSTHGSVTVYQPHSTRLQLAYGVVGDYLVIGANPTSVGRTADAWNGKQSLQTAPTYAAVLPGLAHGPSFFGYVDASQLMALAIQAGELHAGSDTGIDEPLMQNLERLAQADACAAGTVALTAGRLRASLNVPGSDQAAAWAGEAFWQSIGASLTRAREVAKRAVSAANLRGVVTSALVYANEHKGVWPASLADLLQQGAISIEMLRSPYDGTGPRTIATADREAYVIYRKNIPANVSPQEVVAGEREIRNGEGANFAYADGHVEFVREPDASRVLTVLKSQSR
jgi:prepilin-type processing-associated H-X9-DG protein